MVQKWLPRPRLLIVSSRGLFFSLSCLPASECPPRDFCKSLLFSTAELSQGQQRFHECLRVAAGYIERWHSASWPALLVQLGTEVACNDLAPSLPSMKTDTLGKQDRCCGCWSPPDPTAASASGGCTACEELLDAVAVSDADSCKHFWRFLRSCVVNASVSSSSPFSFPFLRLPSACDSFIVCCCKSLLALLLALRSLSAASLCAVCINERRLLLRGNERHLRTELQVRIASQVLEPV